MKDNGSENERIESLLRSVHMAEPSPQLKGRITAEAAKAWDQSSSDLSWLVPLRWLAVSAAAAIVTIWLANYSSDLALGQWRSPRIQAAIERPADVDRLPELPSSLLARRLACMNPRSLTIGASSLNDHVESVRRVLDEAVHGGGASPAGGRSSLILRQAGDNSYS